MVSSFTGYTNTTAINTAVASDVLDVQLTAAGIYVLNSQGLQSNLSLSRTTYTSSPNQHLNGGYRHFCVTDSRGAPECWGDNNFGQTTVPAELASGVLLLRAGVTTTAESSQTAHCCASATTSMARTPFPLASPPQSLSWN